ncbi:MAG: peptidase C69 [Candidatus Tectimicrobiota bacterium]|nr:MAG: peptidase C69 [Candidatus Tectomicrobia bacterium]
MELYELRQHVELALDLLAAEPGIVEAEVCASWCTWHQVAIAYDADRPGEALAAPCTTPTYGIGMLVVVAPGQRVGFGYDSDDLSPEAIRFALERARENAMPDPDFVGLARPLAPVPPLPAFFDPEVVALAPEELASLAADALHGALSACQEAGYTTGVAVSGTLESRTTHLVVGNTHGLLQGETTTAVLGSLSVALRRDQVHGTDSRGTTHLQDFAAAELGREAAQRALLTRGGVTLPAGSYPVIFGPRAVADLLQDLVLPALSLDTVAAGTSPWGTCLGQQVAAPLLFLVDDGRQPRLLGSHAITGEGLPTGRTALLEAGRLVGFLADVYHAQKLAPRLDTLPPRNGMRFATDGASFRMRPGIFPTNVLVSGEGAVAPEALLAAVRDGIYVDSLWATQPRGELRSGRFTATVIGPSFHIRQGKRQRPLRPGTLRLEDDFCDLLRRLDGLSTATLAVPLATGHSLVVAPELRCPFARFTA